MENLSAHATCLYQVKHGIDDILYRRLLRVVGVVVLCIGVSTSPGATALKRMPSLAYSIARFMVAEFKPPFVIIETEPFTPAIGRSASAAVMVTTHPDFCFNISFTVR